MPQMNDQDDPLKGLKDRIAKLRDSSKSLRQKGENLLKSLKHSHSLNSIFEKRQKYQKVALRGEIKKQQAAASRSRRSSICGPNSRAGSRRGSLSPAVVTTYTSADSLDATANILKLQEWLFRLKRSPLVGNFGGILKEMAQVAAQLDPNLPVPPTASLLSALHDSSPSSDSLTTSSSSLCSSSSATSSTTTTTKTTTPTSPCVPSTTVASGTIGPDMVVKMNTSTVEIAPVSSSVQGHQASPSQEELSQWKEDDDSFDSFDDLHESGNADIFSNANATSSGSSSQPTLITAAPRATHDPSNDAGDVVWDGSRWVARTGVPQDDSVTALDNISDGDGDSENGFEDDARPADPNAKLSVNLGSTSYDSPPHHTLSSSLSSSTLEMFSPRTISAERFGSPEGENANMDDAFAFDDIGDDDGGLSLKKKTSHSFPADLEDLEGLEDNWDDDDAEWAGTMQGSTGQDAGSSGSKGRAAEELHEFDIDQNLQEEFNKSQLEHNKTYSVMAMLNIDKGYDREGKNGSNSDNCSSSSSSSSSSNNNNKKKNDNNNDDDDDNRQLATLFDPVAKRDWILEQCQLYPAMATAKAGTTIEKKEAQASEMTDQSNETPYVKSINDTDSNGDTNDIVDNSSKPFLNK